MQAAGKSSARAQHHHRPAAERATGPSAAAAFAIDNRPATIAQRLLVQAIYNSPPMAAQRKQLRSVFGAAAQFAGDDPQLEERQMKAAPGQGVSLQGRFAPVQKQPSKDEEEEDEETLQPRFAARAAGPLKGETLRGGNDTGLPDGLKAGIESLSGMSMDNVKVHYNSSEPAQLDALAYARGIDIHVAPGQEQHLPHEAWHLVQQAQGRVKPTRQLARGFAVNDDARLEHEADIMGDRAVQMMEAMRGRNAVAQAVRGASALSSVAPVQRVLTQKTVGGVQYEFDRDAGRFVDFCTLQNGAAGPALVPQATANIPTQSGSRAADYAAANLAAGLNATPVGYTWHHHINAGQMELIDSAVHRAFGHSGGFAAWGN